MEYDWRLSIGGAQNALISNVSYRTEDNIKKYTAKNIPSFQIDITQLQFDGIQENSIKSSYEDMLTFYNQYKEVIYE